MKISKAGVPRFFLLILFPIHFWAFIQYFGDIEWITDRSQFGDAIGVGAYGLVAALIESVLVFVCWGWDEKKRIGLLGSLYLVAVFWAIVHQFLVVYLLRSPGIVATFLVSTGHPLRWGGVILSILVVIVVLSVVFPIYAFYKDEKDKHVVYDWMNRLMPLSILYLVIDVIAFFLVVFRNLER
jgi:hypothetical protein